MTVARHPNRWQFSAPAWLLSIVFHLAGFLVLAVAMRNVDKHPTVEPVRMAEIVMVQMDPQQRPQYFAPPKAVEPVSEVSDATNSTPFSALPSAQDFENPRAEDGLPRQLPVMLPGIPSSVETQIATTRGRRKALPTSLSDEEFIADERARLAAQRKQLGPATSVTIFGTAPSEGRSFVFVIDRSKSMGGEGLGALDAAAKELEAGLCKLTAEHQFQILAYNNKHLFLGERKLLAASDENKNAIRKFFTELAAFGGTEHETALHTALRLKPDVIFWLTDGGDPELNQGQLHGIHQQAGIHTVIHGIQFGFGPLQDADNFMMRAARQNRGVYRYVDMSISAVHR